MSNETEHGKLNGMAHETTNATFAELRKLLARPTLHERTGEKFWDDPYISKQMLKAHLDPETDAASRKPEFIERSVEWICSLVPGGARLLDIGCGPGLYTKRFAGRGLRVTGMDISENSINYAREHDPDSTYIVQNYLKMDIDGLGFAGAFDIITLIWCDYGALVPEERRVLLGHVGRALKPGGLFLFDVFTPMWNIGRSDNMTWEHHGGGGFWRPAPHICMNAEYYYGHGGEAGGDAVGLTRVVVLADDRPRCYNIWNYFFDEKMLVEEVGSAGFAPAGFYGDAAGEPLPERPRTICAVFKKYDRANYC